jgi:cupin fold WbuC family metalloprotein
MEKPMPNDVNDDGLPRGSLKELAQVRWPDEYRPNYYMRLDPSCFRRDIDARSLSFYTTDPTVGVDQNLINKLIAESNGGNARICLHTMPSSNFHEMIILEREGYYFPPHKHTNKAQSCNILRGEAAVFVFDDKGNVKRKCILGRDGNIIFRIGEEEYHLTLPLTPFIVYHEGKPGPFEREGDSIYAEWAPKREDKKAVAAYLEGLRRLI